MHLGDVIKQYRHEHGKMSMKTFADKCGLSKGYIAMLERNINPKTGELVVPSAETFIKVAGAMNMTLGDIDRVVDENRPMSLCVIAGYDKVQRRKMNFKEETQKEGK